MRLYIRQKIFLLGFGLTFVLVFLAFILSFFTYKNRIEKKNNDTINLSLDVSKDWFSDLNYKNESYSTAESRSDVFNYILEMYNKVVANDENYPDINNGATVNDLYNYLAKIYSDLYPIAPGSMGMSRTGPINRAHYKSINSDLVSTLSIADGILGKIVYYDKENDRYLNIVDTGFRFDDNSNNVLINMPGSYEKLTELDHKMISEIEKNGYYQEGTIFTYFVDLKDSNNNLIARIILRYDKTVVVDAIREFAIILALTLVGISVLLVISYVFFAHLMIVKNIKKLTKTSDDFKEKLLNSEKLEVIDTDIKSRDEIGNLSESFLLLENGIINYAERIEEETKEREKINAELSVASKIQLEALPVPTYIDKNITFNASITSAKEVGGDFYDYFYIDNDNFAIIISDVSGKGIPASLFMMKCKELIKSKLLSKISLEDLCFDLNNELLENNDEGLFITAFIGIYNIKNDILSFINCGHEKPFLIGDNIEKLETNSNFILGGVSDFKYKQENIKLNNKKLFLYTDGLNEAINLSREEFSYDGINSTLNNNINESNDTILINMKKSLDEFTKGNEQFDDVTMVVFNSNLKIINLEFKNPSYEIIDLINNKINNNFYYLDKKILSESSIIIDEMLNNYISYEKNDSLIINIIFEIKEEYLYITLMNNGEKFDPLELPDKYINDESEITGLGGFGLTIVRNLVDDIKYSRENNKNVLIMKKKI